MFQLKSYLKFLWNSQNAHGLHSPFVFALATQCFYSREMDSDYSVLENYRHQLLQNHDVFEVTDFGAGSKVFKSNRRAVSKIAKTAGISKKRAQMLFRVVRYFKPENTLEIGTSLGLATAAMALGNPKGNITTLEGCPQTAAVAQKQFQQFGLGNVKLVIGEFQQYLNQDQSKTKNLVYFDGNHQKEATLQYFEQLLSTVNNDSVWIFDDIHWSKEMEQAWETIKKNPKVTATIDTFQWGFVFFRQEQQKEHFVVRMQHAGFLNAILGARRLWGLLQ